MRKSVVSILASAVLTLTACAPGGSGSGDSGASEVRIAFSNPTLFSTGLPYYVAKDQGFYKDEGLDVTATFTGGGAETVQAVVSGSADIGTETSSPAAVGAFVSGAPIKIVSASTTGLDIVYFTTPKTGLTKTADLAGKRVGYSATGGSSHIGLLELSAMLEDQGLAPIKGEVIGGPADQYTAVETGQIDAGWTQPPFFTKDLEDGKLVEVADGAKVDKYADVSVRVNIANQKFLEEDPDAAKAFLRAQDRAFTWIFENPKEAVKIWQEAADLKISEADLLLSFDYLNPEAYKVSETRGREAILADAKKFGFVKKSISPEQADELFDDEYLPGS